MHRNIQLATIKIGARSLENLFYETYTGALPVLGNRPPAASDDVTEDGVVHEPRHRLRLRQEQALKRNSGQRISTT